MTVNRRTLMGGALGMAALTADQLRLRPGRAHGAPRMLRSMKRTVAAKVPG